MKLRSYYNGGVYRLSFKRKNNFMHLAPWRVLGIDKCAALTRAAAKHTSAPQAAQQKKGAAERSRPGLTA